MLPRPPELHDVASRASSEEFPAQAGSRYHDPLSEWSQGFDMTLPFDGQDVPLSYLQGADPYAIDAAWLAAEQSRTGIGAGTRTATAKGIQASHSQQSRQYEAPLRSTVTSSARASGASRTTDYTDPSTSCTMTSTFVTGKGGSSRSDDNGCHTNGTTRNKTISESDPDSSSTKQQEHQMRWETGVPVVMITIVVAFLVFLSFTAMSRTNRVITSAVTVGRARAYPQKSVSSVPRVTVKPLALPKGSIKAKSTSWHEMETTNVVDTQADLGDYGSFTPDSETTVRERAPSSSKRTRQSQTSKRAAVPEAPSGGHYSVETRENDDYLLAFPFQHPRRPMCGDVFYTICHPSPQHEFHYRRSMNVCVETAADIVHSCNRGDNRFVSLTHCRQRCVRVGRRPADECFGEPLFTNCARQDVVSNWWFFDGRKCTLWDFPSGGCPANDSAVFRTAQECRRQCVTAGLGSSPCRLPGAVACERQHLKYPFFADLSVRDGLFRCLRSSPDVLRDRRCLTGSNRFRTLEACKVTCQKAPTT